ncbi:MAG: DUF1624 domain-containing protein [Sphingobacteriales bacterium]|nr:MAG: DUF1624 domain-containing protein [Sphingobacteriales bacterium]
MPAANKSRRILSIDILRGIVMVIMALDHARDFFSGYRFSPTDMDHANTPMFFTRWITHFCAPVFIFLSGTSAFLSAQNKSKYDTAKFLVTRGIWLIILEVTIVHFAWAFNWDFSNMFLQVIWAIGWSMIFLAAMVFLPLPAILGISLLIILGHNALDGIRAESFGQYKWSWHILHEVGPFQLTDGYGVFVMYPIVPWIAVMAAGYCFGSLLLQPEGPRNQKLTIIGISAILLFIILRAINVYGDPLPWSYQDNWHHTLLSFLNCNKYPPSLLYLLMTLGSAILLLPQLEKMKNGIGRFFTVFGKVPMFYYIMHLLVLHGMALLTALALGFPARYFTESTSSLDDKPHWGYSLPAVYMWWMLGIAILYLPCLWYMRVKSRNKKWWLSYL